MTDLKIEFQLLDEVRVSLGNLVAEFTSAQKTTSDNRRDALITPVTP